MALFSSAASGLVVGRISSALMIPSLMKTHSSGGAGMHRMKAPRGMETKPRASDLEGGTTNEHDEDPGSNSYK